MRALIGRRRLAIFALIVGLQVALVLGVIFIEERRQTGVEIVLESLPVDPRDPLRGDYVILRYRAEEVDGLPGARPRVGEEVYVTFEQRGRYWEPTALDARNPARDEWDRGRVAIRARVVLESAAPRRVSRSWRVLRAPGHGRAAGAAGRPHRGIAGRCRPHQVPRG